MKFNINASPLDLYDMIAPSAPSHLTVRNAIENHRNDERAPVAMSPDIDGVRP